MFGFSVCSGESTVDATQNDIFGEKDCYCENQSRAMFYWWSVDVLARTPAEGDDDNCCAKCVTDEFACDTIRTMSPGCITCGCGNPDDVPESCDITQDITVYQTADASEQTVLPNVAGRTTLIVSDTTGAGNGWASHAGEVATDDGAGNFTYSIPAAGSIVLSSIDQVLWVAFAGGAGWYYPSIQGSVVSGNLTLISAAPQVTLLYARTIVVELTTDGTTWTPFYSGPETVMASGYTAAFSPDPIQARTTYFFGEDLQCSSDPVLGSIPPDACAVARTIAYGADSSEQGTLPNTLGIEYLIISDDTGSGNAWASQVGDIATGDGVGGWTYATPADLSTTRTTLDYFGGANVIWLTSGGGTITPYFPPLLASVLWDTATITTDWTPDGHNIIARTVVIQQSTDGGTTWTTAYSGVETALSSPLDITITPAVSPMLRVLYGGLCPGQSTVTVSVVPARSLRISANATMSYGAPTVGLVVPMRQQTFSFGTYMKAAGVLNVNAFYFDYTVSRSNGTVPGGATPGYYPIIVSLIKDSLDARWAGNHNIILSCACRSTTNLADDVYSRAYEIPGLRTLLEDGNWHSIDMVRSTVTPNSYDLADWKVYVDGVLVTINEIYTVGTVTDLATYVNVPGNYAPRLIADGLTGGRDLLWKNTYWCTGALTQSQITNVARTGAWEGAVVGIQAMFGYDLPATCSWPPVLPYMGERYNPAIQNDPAGGNLIPGGMTLVRSGPTGNGEFVNDVPPTLLFP
jgi:hypothetical protein